MGISVIIEDTDITAILELGEKIKKWDTAIFRYKVYRNDRAGYSLVVNLHAKEST